MSTRIRRATAPSCVRMLRLCPSLHYNAANANHRRAQSYPGVPVPGQASADRSSNPYTILAAIGGPDQLAVLLAIALPLARARQGRVIPLYVGAGNGPPTWLSIAPETQQDVVDEPIVISSRDVSGRILAVARELRPDLLLLHWKGHPSRGRYLLGRTLDPVILYAPCDVAVVRVSEKPSSFAERMRGLRRVLVPSGGGPNASLALGLGLDLGPDVEVTALRVAMRSLGPTGISAEWDLLRRATQPWADNERLQPRVALASGVAEGILRETHQGYDLALIGATRESLVDRLLFGNLPQQLAIEAPLPLIIVRRHDPTAVGALRRARWRLVNLLPQLTPDERLSVYRQVRHNARTNKDYYVMMTLAATIASLGMLLDSPAVIIGAMLMAPMMSALLGIGLGVVQGDAWLLRLAMRTVILGATLVMLVSALVGLAMPGSTITGAMLARGNPTLLDLAVALISGAAAAYALGRRDVASALPGVAIAVALVPPLATVGLAAVSGATRVALGASLLFLTNLVAIASAAGVVFLWMGFHPGIAKSPTTTAEQIRARTFRGGLVGTAVLLVCVAAVLGLLTANSIRRAVFRSSVQRALEEQIAAMGGQVALSEWRIVGERRDAIQVANIGRHLRLEVSVQATRDISYDEVVALQERVALQLQRTVSLALTVVPTTRLDPFMPPSLTPAPLPTATHTASPTIVPSLTPTSTSTATGTACTCKHTDLTAQSRTTFGEAPFNDLGLHDGTIDLPPNTSTDVHTGTRLDRPVGDGIHITTGHQVPEWHDECACADTCTPDAAVHPGPE